MIVGDLLSFGRGGENYFPKRPGIFYCSFQTFARMVEVLEIVVVCDPSYRDVFEGALHGF